MDHSRRLLPILASITLVLAACGASDDSSSTSADTSSPPGQSEGTTPSSEPEGGSVTSEAVPAGPDSYTSPDGMLTIDAPADGMVITIAEVAETVDLPEGAETLATYEFGPDGATFDPPLAVEVELDADMETDGIAATHVSSDGTREPIDFEFTATGISFELSSFSTVILAVIPYGGFAVVLRAPDRAPVQQDLLIEAAIENADGLETNFQVSVPEFEVSYPILRRSGELYYCDEVGTGEVLIDGVIFANAAHTTFEFPRVKAEATVECYEAATTLAMEPPDFADAEPLDFEVVARSPFAIGVPTTAIPQGGWIGFVIETAAGFSECAIADSREQDPPVSGCATFDASGLGGIGEPIETTVEGDVTWLDIPDDMYSVIDGQFNWTVDGNSQPVVFASLDVFGADGSKKQGVIPIEQLNDLFP